MVSAAIEALDAMVARGARLLTYAHLETLDDETLWQVCRGLEHASGVRERYRDVLPVDRSAFSAHAAPHAQPAFEAILRELACERATRLAAIVYRAVGSNADLVRYLRERLEKLDLRAVDWYAVLAIHASKLEAIAPISENKYFAHAARHLSATFRDKFVRWETAANKHRKQLKQQQLAARKSGAGVADRSKSSSTSTSRMATPKSPSPSPSNSNSTATASASASNELDESRAVALLELLSGDPQLGLRLRLVSDSLDFPVAQLVDEEHSFVSRLLDIASHATNLSQGSTSAPTQSQNGALSRSSLAASSGLVRKSAIQSGSEHSATAKRTASTRASFGGHSTLNKSVKWSDESQLGLSPSLFLVHTAHTSI